MKSTSCFLFLLAVTGSLQAVPVLTMNPIVYNMVYRRAALPVPYDTVHDDIFYFSNNPLVLAGANHAGHKVEVDDILTLRLTCVPFWFETKTAILSEVSSSAGSRPRFDDVLLYAGYDFIAQPFSQLSFYGLLGIPTSREDPRVTHRARGHWSFALGCDSAFSTTANDNPDISYGVIASGRFLHLASRIVRFINPKELILQDALKFHPGSFIDLLVAGSIDLGNYHIEVGYDLTVNVNTRVQRLQASDPDKAPYFDEGIHQDTGLGHAVYAAYVRTFAWYEVPMSVGFGASYEHGNQSQTSIWTVWWRTSISF